MYAVAKGMYIEESISSTLSGKDVSILQKTYLTDNNLLFTQSTHPQRILYDLNTQRVYLIDDIKRRYSSTSFNNYKESFDQGISSIFNLLVVNEILCRESGEKKRIYNYDCFEIVIYLPKIATMISLWLTKDLPALMNLYYSFSQKAELGNGMKKMISIMKQYDAFPVESITAMVRPKESTRYLKVRLKKISYNVLDSIFTIPYEYKNIPYLANQ